MFGLTTKKKYNKLLVETTKVGLENCLNDFKIKTLESIVKTFKSKEFRKKELEQYFAQVRLNGLIPREHFEVSWKEYQSLFQEKSYETKKDLQKESDRLFLGDKVLQKMDSDFKKQESLLKSVKEILDWYKSEELQFTPESKNDIKDMFLNLEIAYKNMTGTFGEHKSDSEEIIKEI